MFGRRPPCLALSALILSCVALGGCARRPPPEPGRYYSGEEGFSIRLPKEWEKKEGFMGTTVIALSPQEGQGDQFRENVNVVVEELPKAMSAQAYYDLNLASMRKLMTDFATHEESELTVGKTIARRLVYSHRMGTLKLKVLVYGLVKGRRGYSITCSASPEQFARYVSEFEGIAESFRFE